MTANDSDDGLWIRRYHPAPAAAVRLLCLPHAGGAASFAIPLARSLAPAVEVLAVQLPGRQDRRAEEPVADLHALADAVAMVLTARPDPRPLAILGHSMGAALGFEVALRLRGTGVEVSELFAAGRFAPSCIPVGVPPINDTDSLMRELSLMSGTDERLLRDEELLRMIMPAVRADYLAATSYRCAPAARLDCRITALAGESDPRTPLADVRRWREHTTGGFELRTFPGGHFFISEHREEICRLLIERLARAALA